MFQWIHCFHHENHPPSILYNVYVNAKKAGIANDLRDFKVADLLMDNYISCFCFFPGGSSTFGSGGGGGGFGSSSSGSSGFGSSNAGGGSSSFTSWRWK